MTNATMTIAARTTATRPTATALRPCPLPLLLAVLLGLGLLALGSRRLHAQDVCAAEQMTVAPCLAGELHVNAGGTGAFTVSNYGYIDDTYYVRQRCQGIVRTCSTVGGAYQYAAAGASTTVSIAFQVSGPQGTGTVGGTVDSWTLGGEVDVATTVYGQPPVVLDSAQTPMYGADQNAARCAANCFSSTLHLSTVPFVTLGQARNVTLVYTQDQAHPEPFIYATVSPAADGPAISRYQLSATLDGAPVRFTTGEQTLTFTSPGPVPVRLGGQTVIADGQPHLYTLVVTVVVQYADGTSATLSYTTDFAVHDASTSPVAHGWTIGNVTRLACWWNNWSDCVIFGGDGSIEVFRAARGYVAADHSTLGYGNGHWTRQFPDGSAVWYDDNGLEIAEVSPTGRRTTFSYDTAWRLIKISDPEATAGARVPHLELAYGTYGLATITETGGPGPARVTTISVDPNHYLNWVKDPDGNQTSVIYYGVNAPIDAVTDRRGQTTYFWYDSFHKLSAMAQPPIPLDQGNGTTTTANPMTYYTAWQGIGVPTTPTAANPPPAAPVSDIVGVIQTPGSQVTQFSVNNWGQALTTVDPASQWTLQRYDRMYPAWVHYQNGGADSVVYDALGRPTRVQAAGDSATYYYWNAVSQLDSVRGQNVVATDYRYNPDHTLLSVRNASGVSESFTYTALQQVLTATDGAGHQMQYGYDAVFGNLTSVTAPGNRTTTTVLDAEGRDSVVQAPLTAAVTTLYDVVNRPVQVIPAGRPATVVTYDALFPTDVQDATGNVVHTDYNALGWPVARRDANNATETFRYDAAGHRTSWTNRRGDLMTYTYDPDGRVTSRSGRGVSDSYSYSADAYWGDIMVAQNAVETDSLFHRPALTGVTGADSTVTWLNGVRYRVNRPYSGAVAVPLTTTITASSGVGFQDRQVTLDPTRGLANAVQDGFNTASPGYDGEALPTSLFNPAFGTRTADYTSLHSPIDQQFTDPTLQTTFTRAYHYDPVGRIDQSFAFFQGAGQTNEQDFHYDPYGQLSGVETRGGNCFVQAPDPDRGALQHCTDLVSSSSYSYDAVGNRTDLGATYFAGNRLANFNGGFHEYDADGNLTHKCTASCTPTNQFFYWNAESRLDSLTYDGYYTVRYEYNALGQPVKKSRNGALDRVWLWDGDQLLAEFDGSNNRIADYQYAGLDQPYAVTVGGSAPSSIQYPEQDALGNVVGTHTGTTVSETISYDPWGMPSYSGDLSSRLMWKGLLWEGDVVGLYYMRGRWYDPQLGRFIQEDPLHAGVNDYVFAGDDPINGSDPTGLDDGPICVVFSTGVQACSGPVQLPPVEVTADGPSGVDWASVWSSLTAGLGSPAGLGPSSGGTGGTGATANTSSTSQQPTTADKAKKLAQLTLACTLDHYGVSALLAAAGAAGVYAGLPTIPKRFVTPGSSGATSRASVFFRDVVDTRLPFRVLAPTLERPLAMSAKLGTVLGRWTPIVGWGLLAYDAYRIGRCVANRY